MNFTWDADNPTESAAKILKEKPAVCVHHNREAGNWQYSVALKGTGLWLDSFKTLGAAEKFLQRHDIKDFVFISDKD